MGDNNSSMIKQLIEKRLMKNLLLVTKITVTVLFFFILSSPNGFASNFGADATIEQQQRKTITGKIVDAAGEPIIGANILEVGTTNGTVTDVNGNYSLVVANNATIRVSYIGYGTQDVNTSGRTSINLTLQDDSIGLEEFVAIGYGVQKKSVVTGAISSIAMDVVQPLSTQRVDQMLQGRAAGVLVLNTDGAPGSETTIRIRGMNSIQGGNAALIVIDGFQGGDLRSLNPNDIANIEVLKDASATAIYGAQGANGVILITTKKGTTDKPSISFASDFGFSRINMGGIEMMNAAEYAREMNLVELANDFDRTPLPPFTEAEISEFERTGGTDWVKEVYRQSLTQTHQLSLSGRTNVVNYFVSGSFLDQQGIMINSGYNRYSLRTNVSATVTNWLDVSLNWDGALQNQFGAIFGSGIDWPGNPVTGAFVFAPTIPVYTENGDYSRASTEYGDRIIWNPVASAKESKNENRQFHNNINLQLTFKLLESLTLQVTGGARLSQSERVQFYNNDTFTGQQNNGSGRVDNSFNRNIQNSNILTYIKNFDKHHLNVVAVGEVKYNTGFGTNINNNNFTTQQTEIYDLAGAQIQRTGSWYGDRTILSGIGRVNYDYDNKYIASASIRADGSSVFGANNKWGYFPAVSLGWRINQENFMRDKEWLDNLMVRTSWGNTGNQAISNYQTLSKIGGAGLYPWRGGSSVNLGYAVTSASNPNLKWESTRQFNVGIDVSILRGKFRFSGEYYDKVTSNLLMQRELPRSTGLSSIIDNVGSMGNRGVELSLDGDFTFNDLKWAIGLNVTRSKTTVLDLGEVEFLSYAAGGSGHSTNIPFMFLRKGEPFGQIMGFGYEGTWKIGEENEAARYGQMPGDPRYTDVNNDGRIDYDNDWKVIGNALPKLIFGINNQFEYKNFDLTFLLQGTYGNDVFNVARIKRETSPGFSKELLKRWTPENQNTDIPALHKATYRDQYRRDWLAAHPDQPLLSTITFPTSGSNVTERWIEDGSYMRLKNITLGYTFTNLEFVNRMRIFVSGMNLLTFTRYKGFDPEASSYTGNDATLGTDYNNYPPSRTISFGLNVTF